MGFLILRNIDCPKFGRYSGVECPKFGHPFQNLDLYVGWYVQILDIKRPAGVQNLDCLAVESVQILEKSSEIVQILDCEPRLRGLTTDGECPKFGKIDKSVQNLERYVGGYVQILDHMRSVSVQNLDSIAVIE